MKLEQIIKKSMIEEGYKGEVVVSISCKNYYSHYLTTSYIEIKGRRTLDSGHCFMKSRARELEGVGLWVDE
jgi:hypothetical protein